MTDFRQTFVTGASWDTDDLITFLGQKVKVQGHTIAAEARSTRRYRQVQLFLVRNCVAPRGSDIPKDSLKKPRQAGETRDEGLERLCRSVRPSVVLSVCHCTPEHTSSAS